MGYPAITVIALGGQSKNVLMRRDVHTESIYVFVEKNNLTYSVR